MPEYTPTLEDMKYAAGRYYTAAEFDSALAAHDAAVRADQARKVIDWYASRSSAMTVIAALEHFEAVVLTPTTKEPSDG